MARGAALLVIDLQVQFTEPSSPFAVDGVDAVVDGACAFADEAREQGAHVVWVRQEARTELPMATSTRRFAQGVQLHRGRMAAFDARVQPRSEDTVLVKRRQSAFAATDLDLTLRGLRVDHVLICGVTTNVCCLASALDATALGYRVTALSDLTAALPIPADGPRPALDADAVRNNALAFIGYAAGMVAESRSVLRGQAS